jgi:hypothetical protein
MARRLSRHDVFGALWPRGYPLAGAGAKNLTHTFA